MQTSQLKCIHSQHFVKKYEKRQELCNATPVNTYSILYRCLRLPKQKRKHAFLFEQQFSPKILLFCTIDTIKTANVLRASSFFTTKMFILFCTAMPQRSETFFCIAHAFGKDFAHFLDACLD